MNSNNFYDRLRQIPPSYQETTEHLPPVPPYQANGASQLYITSNEPAVLEVSNLDNPSTEVSNPDNQTINPTSQGNTIVTNFV